MLDLKSKVIRLSDNDLREKAPSIFTETPGSETSKHYTHIPTYKVVQDMKQLGWFPVDAQQVKTRKTHTKGVGKHLVVFQNDDIVVNGEDGDVVYPRVLLTNSHDGKNSFQFQAGLFRMICSNGLVVSDHNFSKLKIRHMGYDFTELRKTIEGLVETLPLTVESMNKFKATQLNTNQKVDFAVKALALRLGGYDFVETVDIEQLLKPSRNEDEGDDVWSVYNVIQEKVIDGDFEYSTGNKIRKARTIKNFKQDTELNEQLFELAHGYVA